MYYEYRYIKTLVVIHIIKQNPFQHYKPDYKIILTCITQFE